MHHGSQCHKSTSDHPTTAAALDSRGVRFLEIDGRHPPPDLTQILHQFRQVVGYECRRTSTDETNILFDDDNLAKLQTAMTIDYETEVAFDKALCEGLRSCMEEYCLQNCDNNMIILQPLEDNHNYAVGFARQVRPALDLLPKIQQQTHNSKAGKSTSGGLESQSQSDHSVCLFEKVGVHRWKVKECFGIIELKMSDTCCDGFKIKGNGAVAAVDLKSNHGALGRVILYTIGSVILYHARNGILRPSVPLAVIAGRRATQASSSRLRWVSSLLHAPTVRGNRFTFSVEDFGNFHVRQSDQDNESAALAVRLYLSTLLFGLELAISVRNLRNGGTVPLPVPASGQFLMIGERVLETVVFCASPIPGARPISSSWSISQGDLFKGVANLHEILNQRNLNFLDFRSDKEKQNRANVPVLVKVFSAAVHKLLIAPLETMSALSNVKLGNAELAEQIGNVLYALVRTNMGGVTIMSDLRELGYASLSPQVNAGKHIPALWAGFKTLVSKVLLPLAEMTIIHPDIRPGYDVTFNVLCVLRNNGTEEVASMRLIDLESLVWIDNWAVPQEKDVVDGRFLPRILECDAVTYVWWQCIFVAYVWKNEIPVGDVSKAQVIDVLKTVLLDDTIESGWPEWLVNLRHHTKNPGGNVIDSSCVEQTLIELERLFEVE